MSFSLTALLLRFLLGGTAVVGSTVIARSLGGKVGGIFAAFPAVYLAAIISVAMQEDSEKARLLAMVVSKGALLGMATNIVCAVISAVLIIKYGWRIGLVFALCIWTVIVVSIYTSIYSLA